MAKRGAKTANIPEAGVVLTLKIRGVEYPCQPSFEDVLRLDAAMKAILDAKPKGQDLSVEDRAQIAKLLIELGAVPHVALVRSLPPEMQGAIVGELWQWWVGEQPAPVRAADPTSGSFGSPVAAASPSPVFAGGDSAVSSDGRPS